MPLIDYTSITVFLIGLASLGKPNFAQDVYKKSVYF